MGPREFTDTRLLLRSFVYPFWFNLFVPSHSQIGTMSSFLPNVPGPLPRSNLVRHPLTRSFTRFLETNLSNLHSVSLPVHVISSGFVFLETLPCHSSSEFRPLRYSRVGVLWSLMSLSVNRQSSPVIVMSYLWRAQSPFRWFSTGIRWSSRGPLVRSRSTVDEWETTPPKVTKEWVKGILRNVD